MVEFAAVAASYWRTAAVIPSKMAREAAESAGVVGLLTGSRAGFAWDCTGGVGGGVHDLGGAAAG